MPFHPRLEFALNRISILGSAAADELALLNSDEFSSMLQLSVASIGEPKKFLRALRLEEAAQLQEKIKLVEKAGNDELLVAQLQQRMQSLLQDEEEGTTSSIRSSGRANGGAAAGRVIVVDEDDTGAHGKEEDDDEDLQPAANIDDEEEEDEVLKVEKEAHRIKKELHSMSAVLLDALSMSVDRVKQNGKAEAEAKEVEEQEDVEPLVQVGNGALLRFSLTILSDTALATALRIPLLQGDLPLLARSVLRCYSSNTDNGQHKTLEQQQERRTIIFLTLDMLATMCADSAACRLAFSCCVPLIASVLQTFVISPHPQQRSSAPSGLAAKKAPMFVRPANNKAEAEKSDSSGGGSNADNENQTTADDVIFAGSAALETMLFHCSEAILAFVAADGLKTLVGLYRQLTEERRKKEEEQKLKGEKIAASNPTDATAFIKRVLIHIRLCGVLSDRLWATMLDKKCSSGQQEQEEQHSYDEVTRAVLSSVCTADVFGTQGADIGVDELRWALSGGIKIGKINT